MRALHPITTRTGRAMSHRPNRRTLLEVVRKAWQEYVNDSESVDALAALLDSLEAACGISLNVSVSGHVTARDTLEASGVDIRGCRDFSVDLENTLQVLCSTALAVAYGHAINGVRVERESPLADALETLSHSTEVDDLLPFLDMHRAGDPMEIGEMLPWDTRPPELAPHDDEAARAWKQRTHSLSKVTEAVVAASLYVGRTGDDYDHDKMEDLHEQVYLAERFARTNGATVKEINTAKRAGQRHASTLDQL